MNGNRIARKLLAVVFILAFATNAAGLALTPESEVGFRRFMQLVQEGAFGADVDNANIGISREETSVELVVPGGESKRFRLSPKTGDHRYSRYFDITAVAAATQKDVAALGALLDRSFEQDPYVLSGVEALPGWKPPGWRAAWRDRGWRGLLRATEMRVMEPVSRAYAVACTVIVAILVLAACATLWLVEPSDST